MKKIMFLLVAALACVVTACSEDEAVVNNNENLITELNLAIEGSDSRLTGEHVPDVGFKFQWGNGDPVYVYPAEVGESTPVKFVYDAEDQIFKLDAGDGLVEGNKYYAVCGKTQDSGFNSDKICAKMQLWNSLLANLPMVSDIFTATADGTFATLHHMAGIVEIPVKGSGNINTIKLSVFNSTTGDNKLYEDFDVEFGYDEKVGTITKTGSSCSTIESTSIYKIDNPLTLSETEQSLFFPALPGTYNSVKVSYNIGNNGGNSIDISGTLTVQRGKINKKNVAVTINAQ